MKSLSPQRLSSDMARHFTRLFGRMHDEMVLFPAPLTLFGEGLDQVDGLSLSMCVDLSFAIVWGSSDRPAYYFANSDSFFDPHVQKATLWWEKLAVEFESQREKAQLPPLTFCLGGTMPFEVGLGEETCLQLAFEHLFSSYEKEETLTWSMGVNDRERLTIEHSLRHRVGLFDFFTQGFWQKTVLPGPVSWVLIESGPAIDQFKSARQKGEELKAMSPHSSVRQLTSSDVFSFDEDHRRLLEYFLSENKRSTYALEALSKGQYGVMGELLNQSHQSLDEDYGLSCQEQNLLQEIACESDYCLGAKSCGGLILALVESNRTKPFIHTLQKAVIGHSQLNPQCYVVSSVSGGATKL